MTLYSLVAGGGIVISLSLLAVLVSLWPSRRRTGPAICLKACKDAECTPACLRTCHLQGVSTSLLSLQLLLDDLLGGLVESALKLPQAW